MASTLYYYVLNAQGDVIALLNSAGALVASYNYGAWGNYSVHGADGKKTTDPTFIGHINPLRYRGYYYDRETRLYYLQSRYYDFANCRFINADGLLSVTGFIDSNLFVYCSNNPINRDDETGESWKDVAMCGLIVAGIGLLALATISTGGGALLLAGAGISVAAATTMATAAVATGIAATATSILCSSLGNGSGGANKNKPNGKKTSGKSNNGSPGKDYTKARSNKQANEWAKRFGYENAEVLKSDYVARGSQFNMYLNKKTGEIILIGIKTGVEIATGLFK